MWRRLGALMKGIDAIKYILKKTGCIHPFRLSRILALAEMKYYKDHGRRMTDTIYRQGPGAFYIEGLKELVEADPCFVKHEGDPERGRKGCLEYTCPLDVDIDEAYMEYLDKAISEASSLDDMELNEAVVNDPLFKKLLRE
jgi:hydroxypyruvate isomerase